MGTIAVPSLTSMIDKTDLLKTLKTIQSFDPQGSPYVAVQLMGDDRPLFYRSSHFGYIQSVGFGLGALTYVSLAHFQERLKVLAEDSVELGLDGSGILRIASSDDLYPHELRVHTVRKEQAGLKQHDVGKRVHDIDPTAFAGIDVKPFKLSFLPALMQGKLMLPTVSGIVMWQGPESLKPITLYPRDTFLRLVAGHTPSEIVIMSNGYWGVVGDGLTTFVAGHNALGSKGLFDAFNVPGRSIARFPAKRFLMALNQASSLASDADPVLLDPKIGVQVSDRFGNDGKFSLGPASDWPQFRIYGSTAKVIVDALSQSKEDEHDDVVLYDVPTETSGQTLRLSRGSFEVNFKTM
jgi:hypothetical protein